jgi:hypothetical protein
VILVIDGGSGAVVAGCAATSTGVERLVTELSPSIPRSFNPQQYTRASPLSVDPSIAQECWLPATIDDTVPLFENPPP